MKKKKRNSAAIVTIFDASKMTTKGRKDVAKWIRKQARFLEVNGDTFSDRFVARYLYK